MTSPKATQAPSTQYVLPTLRPTKQWAQQIATGAFRPPNPLVHLAHRVRSDVAKTEENTLRFSSFPNAPCAMLLNQSQSQTQCTEDISDTIERIMSMIASAVGQERDRFAAQKESNRVLEQELEQVQRRRKEAQRTLREFENISLSLEAFHEEQLQILQELRYQ
ncbi:hypothetical protein, conserved [Trypanosoma cruzi]|uniref:Uncharacterized protein n=1 Tax=Trypanosoma cruzi (strain CL Brener) TaxID=353153 RepID=Q4DMK0_TRYCC|nr:hypothetical protein, conserved [Trypanosoma cruzi]EAN93741.1 hypothetical protein, conserved [Trypanosoma cruzi]|eukprot:XP_815592.1 hypothetical protein [Trypanosoma cruzi strain CL Brener]